MTAIAIRVFAFHPVAAAQYIRVLAAEQDFRLVTDLESFQVGVFDGESTSAEEVLTMVRLKFPSMRPVLVSFPCDEKECMRWVFRGMWGLVAYDRYEVDLPRAVREVAEGRLWYPAPVVLRWMRFDVARRASTLGLPLTPREREVMEFLFRRLSNKEIAHILRVSERTVKFHASNIFNKLHVSSRQELAATLAHRLEGT